MSSEVMRLVCYQPSILILSVRRTEEGTGSIRMEDFSVILIDVSCDFVRCGM